MKSKDYIYNALSDIMKRHAGVTGMAEMPEALKKPKVADLPETLKTAETADAAQALETIIFMDAPLADYTTFRVGGPADVLVKPGSRQELAEIVGWCHKEDVPHFVLGNGSNVLVTDKGFRGVVVVIGSALADISINENTLRAGAGAMLSAVAAQAAGASLAGMEFASGIPGTLGGAVYMNAGAYGGEMSHIVAGVTALLPDGSVRRFAREELDFSYRHSIFCENGGIVLEAELELARGDMEEIKSKMKELNRRRAEKQPLSYPSAGSTFKRPEGHYAGKLIEDAGCKGLAVGGAQVSEKHSGFIINTGGASAADIIGLIRLVQARVKENSGVDLETEVKIIGE